MALPQKDFFPLDEIIARWRFDGCDQATLLDYARKDLLIFSIYLPDLGHHRTVTETPQARITTTHRVDLKFTSSDYKWHSIRYLKADDARRILEAKPGQEIGVNVLYSTPERDKKSGTGYSNAHYFTRADLLVTRTERDRFESEHKLNRPGTLPRKAWQWLRDEHNLKVLGIVGTAIVTVFGAIWAVFVWLKG